MAGAAWKAFVFGAVVAGAIGPIALLIFSTGARQGFGAGFFAALGAALADLCYALAAFSIGALLLPFLAGHETAIRIGCALLLVGLGAWMLWSVMRGGAGPMLPREASGQLLAVFALTAVNPMTLVIFSGIVPQLPVAGSFATAGWLALALFLGSLSVQALLAAGGAALGRALPRERWHRAISAVAAAGILAFGVYGLAGAV